MTKSRTLARELALLVLSQIPERNTKRIEALAIENLLQKAFETLTQYWNEALDTCASQIESAQQELLNSEKIESTDSLSIERTREHLHSCLISAEHLLNGLSISLEMPRLLALGNQDEIRLGAMQRVDLVVEQLETIDSSIDSVMEGWRLKRLPRIDRDILRLAFIDINTLKTPTAVACNEAVELAHRYSDEQGRRMINGVLRRLQNSSLSRIS